MVPGAQPTEPDRESRRARFGEVARWAGYVCFGLFLVLTLGANSVARFGGPLAWWPLWHLPAGDGGLDLIGLVSLLPLVSIVGWAAARGLRPSSRRWTWGSGRINIPILALSLLVFGNLLALCVSGDCQIGALARVVLLFGSFAWVYLYVVNERPPLLPIVAGILLLQASIAIGQFFLQRDLGLRLLGELALDPAQPGVSIVMNEGQRWLRGYGLTIHPNVAARTLVTGLLILPILRHEAQGARRWLWLLAGAVGLLGLLVTLSRWAWACLCLGLVIAALPSILAALRTGVNWRRTRVLPVALLIATGLAAFAFFYGDTVAGRIIGTGSAIESRSIWERERDLAIAVRLVADAPAAGVGFGRYLEAAQAYDSWAETVHNVPLLLAAELGVPGLLGWLLLLLLPITQAGAFSNRATQTGLWVGFWSLGLLYLQPHLFTELRSMLLAGLVAGLVALPAALERGQQSAPTVAEPSGVGYH